MTKRENTLRIAESYVGIKEGGRNNTGRVVEMFQRADSLPGEIYAWCQSFANGCWRLATGGRVRTAGGRLEIVGGEMLGDGTASCGIFTSWARNRGLIVSSAPKPGDFITFLFDADRWEDHVGIISSVTRVFPGLLWLVTIEGNTGPTGSVSDPGTGNDGIYKKRRVVRRSKCNIIRVPGTTPADVPPRHEDKGWPIPLPAWVWPWMEWRLGRGVYKGRGYPNLSTRPSTSPTLIPGYAWRRLLAWQKESGGKAA